MKNICFFRLSYEIVSLIFNLRQVSLALGIKKIYQLHDNLIITITIKHMKVTIQSYKQAET